MLAEAHAGQHRDPAVPARARSRARRLPLWALCVLGSLAALCACGGRSSRGALAAPKLEPVGVGALREFDAGLRALRLGGPSARARATQRFEAAVRADDKLWEGWYNLGVLYQAAGDDENAFEAFRRAARINPAHAASLLGQAEAARRLARYDEAQTSYEHVVELSPEDPTAGLRLASLLRESRKTEPALETVRRVLRQDGSSARAYVELGLIYLDSERLDLAELVLTKAAAIDAKNPGALNALALVALARGDDQRAFELFDRATSLDPSFLTARFNKAAVLMDAGDFQRALPELRAVVDADPDDLAARLALGVALRGMGRLDQAEAEYQRVLKAAPRNPDALYNLLVLYMDFKHDEKGARDYLARYLKAAPSRHPKRKDAKLRESEL